MRFSAPKVPTKGWRHTGWRSCADLPDGSPRYFRCFRCERLVTRGRVRRGGCACGWRRLMGCRDLSWLEILQLKLGLYQLTEEERREIRPCF